MSACVNLLVSPFLPALKPFGPIPLEGACLQIRSEDTPLDKLNQEEFKVVTEHMRNPGGAQGGKKGGVSCGAAVSCLGRTGIQEDGFVQSASPRPAFVSTMSGP